MNDQLGNTTEILDNPETIARLLGLMPDGRAYLATELHLRVTVRETTGEDGQKVRLAKPVVEQRTTLVIVTCTPAGEIVTWGELGTAVPPDWDVRLRYMPPRERLFSPAGYRRAVKDRTMLAVEVPDLFSRVVSVVDAFLDLSFGGIAGQRELTELLAVYILATWLSDAYAVFPYLWPNGDKGTGKTKTLTLVARLSYLGQVILAGGTYAALRDMADYGAFLAFDDAENLANPKLTDPDKRALLLAGNRKGATVPVKEPEGKNGWRTRNVSAYCPKAFSAIKLPDPVLARRTIVLPLVRSADPARANHDPEEAGYWPCDARRLIDDCWLFGLRYLPAARAAYDDALSTSLTGPGFEIWRPLIATAVVIEGAGVSGLAARIRWLAHTYSQAREDIEVADDVRLTVVAMADLADVRTFADVADIYSETPRELYETVQFTAAELTKRVNQLAEDLDIAARDAEGFTNARKIGYILERLRVQRDRSPDRKRTRTRSIRRLDALKLYRAYVPAEEALSDDPTPQTSATSENVRTTDAPERCRYCDEPMTNSHDIAAGFHLRPCTPVQWAAGNAA